MCLSFRGLRVRTRIRPVSTHTSTGVAYELHAHTCDHARVSCRNSHGRARTHAHFPHLQAEEEAAAAEDEPDTDTSHLDESPELRAFKDSFKNKYRWNWQMGQLLIDNGIKDPKTGNNFYVNPSNKVLVRGSRTALDKEALKDYLLKAFNDGLIKKF